MRRVRQLTAALIILFPILILLMAESRYAQDAFGQVSPAPAPLGAPAAPGQPSAFATIGALPPLAPAPGTRLTPTPQATPRMFVCSCAGPGFPAKWVGKVPAPSYILARQQATRACESYLLNSHTNSPYITPPAAGFASAPLPHPGAFNSVPPGQVTLPGGFVILNRPLQSGTATGANVEALIPQQCTECACN